MKSSGVKYFVLSIVVSLMMIGGMLWSRSVHAELSFEQVSKSYDDMMSSIGEKPLVSEGEEKKVDLDTKSLQEDSGSSADTDQSTTSGEGIPCELQKCASAEDDMDYEREKGALSEDQKFSQDISEQSKYITDEQKLYVLQALNLQDACALLQSGVIENLRILGNIDKIELDRNYHRIYSADEGDAFTKMLYMLYPSNAGFLSTYGGGDRLNFSRYEGVSQDTIAKFCAMLNDYRNGMISRIPKKNIKVIFPGIGCRNKINLKIEDGQSVVKGSLADFLRRYGFKDEEMYSNDKGKISFSKATICYDFVKTLFECVDLESDSGQYPLYLTEHILMSYMIRTLNQSREIEKLYRDVVRYLSCNESQKVKSKTDLSFRIDNEKIRLGRLNEIINSASFIDLSPYRTMPQSNSATYQIGALSEDGKVQIVLDTFADCADITSRHVVNLLGHSATKSWRLFLSNANFKDLSIKLKEVVAAINNKSQVDFYDFRTRLQMFFLYQSGILKYSNNDKVCSSESGADDVTILSRTLWEYAICNMNTGSLKSGPDKDKGYYVIRYCTKGNVEIECGYLNLLKLMWNIAQALELDDVVRLDLAREKIDALACETKYDERLFKETLVLVFTLFHRDDDFSVKIENCKCENINNKVDITGKVEVEINKDDQVLRFVITQQRYHAVVEHVPIKFNWDDKFASCKYNDELSKLLLRSFTQGTKNCKRILKSTGFYERFTKEFYYGDALYAFKVLQDEGSNIQMISSLIDFEAMMMAERIRVKQKVQSDMGESRTIIKKLSDIFYEIYLKPNEDVLCLDWDQSLYDYEKEHFGVLDVYTGPEHTEEQKVSDFEVIKTSSEGDAVRLIIDVYEVNVIIPTEIYDSAGRKLKVVIGRRGHLEELETVIFKGDCVGLKIMQYTFKDSKRLRSVNFVGDIRDLKIGERAFLGSSVKSFTVQGNITNLVLGMIAFSSSKLESFTVYGSVESLAIGYMSLGEDKTISFTVHGDVKNMMFDICAILSSQLQRFKVLGGIENFNIKDYAFAFSDMISFIVPDGVQNLIIGNGAFEYSALEEFLMPAGMKKLIVGARTFADSYIEDFTVPESVVSLNIGTCAFANSEIENFSALGQLNDLMIASSAFENCNEDMDFFIPPLNQKRRLMDVDLSISSMK